jgi:hypothetical protein
MNFENAFPALIVSLGTSPREETTKKCILASIWQIYIMLEAIRYID